VNIDCGRYRRTVLVTAIAAFAIAVAPSTNAQDLHGVPWWNEIQQLDDATQASLLENVQATLVSEFDATLPAISLERWLSTTLSPVVEVINPQLVEWEPTICLDRYSTIPRSGPELCVQATVRLSADRNVQIVIVMAEADRHATTGRPEWRTTRPSLRDVYIERLEGSTRFDSLDVPSLGALPQMLNTPFAEWPMVDFETTVTWDPPNPAPGDNVRFSISVRNTGRRSLDRAQVDIAITPCCANADVRQQWFPRVAAGQSVRVGGTIFLPEGKAMGSVTVGPWQGHYKRVRDLDPDRPSAWVTVGFPGWYPPPQR
jgi:hypothetical protein